MKLIFLFTTLCVFTLNQNAYAGWYNIVNYIGSIGVHPIHLSLQFYEFGSGTAVEGSYYYDKNKAPIPIYGKYDNGRLKLCEVLDKPNPNEAMVMDTDLAVKAVKCSFSLDRMENGVTGVWTNENSKYKVTLQQIAMLDDSGIKNKIEGVIEIPFWAQTKKHMFIGVYINSNSGTSCMEKIKIINKSKGSVDQEIIFDTVECEAGLLMTPIYMNVEKYSMQDVDNITVHFKDGRMGYSKSYAFNKKYNKYVYIKGSTTISD